MAFLFAQGVGKLGLSESDECHQAGQSFKDVAIGIIHRQQTEQTDRSIVVLESFVLLGQDCCTIVCHDFGFDVITA